MLNPARRERAGPRKRREHYRNARRTGGFIWFFRGFSLAGSAGDTGLAGRYATALFELADEGKALDAVAGDLSRLAGMLESSDDLRRLVRSPVIDRDDQAKAMAAILDKMDAHALTRKFIGVVAANRRLRALGPIGRAYLAELARRRGEVTADVTTAHELNAGQIKALEASLKKAVGGKVAVSRKVDPAILGGMVVKIGSRMVDSSLRTQLEKLKFAMKGAG
jgi:F-type H+-transporting ATPase subunit delta